MGKVLRDGVAGISARPADGVKEKMEFHHGLLWAGKNLSA